MLTRLKLEPIAQHQPLGPVYSPSEVLADIKDSGKTDDPVWDPELSRGGFGTEWSRPPHLHPRAILMEVKGQDKEVSK